MKRLVLFSSPKGKNFEEILEKIFPAEIKQKVFAYVPTHSKYLNDEFTDKWKEIAKKYNSEFRYIDISEQSGTSEKSKIEGANILLITGGNTFWLLDRLRKTGLDEAIKDFCKKEEYVISGWSAGAILMSPTIEVAGLPHRDGSKTSMDNNKWKLTNLKGLGFVDFEIFPHYEESLHKNTFEEYSKKKNGKVKALTDDDYILIDL